MLLKYAAKVLGAGAEMLYNKYSFVHVSTYNCILKSLQTRDSFHPSPLVAVVY